MLRANSRPTFAKINVFMQRAAVRWPLVVRRKKTKLLPKKFLPCCTNGLRTLQGTYSRFCVSKAKSYKLQESPLNRLINFKEKKNPAPEIMWLQRDNVTSEEKSTIWGSTPPPPKTASKCLLLFSLKVPPRPWQTKSRCCECRG